MSNNDLHIFDFKTEQIIAVIKEQDYWDDLRKWELKNNVDQFEFTVSDGTHKAAKLMQQNIVLKRVRDGSFVSYVINESEQDSIDRSKKIYALSEHTKLKKAKVIKPQTLEGYTVNQWLDFALEGTKWQRGVTEYASFRTINIKEFTNPLDLLKTIASAFELEIRFRTEVKGSFIVGRYVDMVRKVGRDNGKEIVLGKDLQGIRRIESSQDAISALVGVGPFNEETGEYLTFEKINGGKLYVADADALQRWTEDGSHKYDIYSPQTEDQNMSAERLKQLTEAELKKRINSTVKYEVTPIALEKIFGLSHEKVNKGNIVHIKDTKFTPPLFLEARLIAADECDTNAANDKYYFGDFKEVEDTRSLLDRMYAQVMGSLAGKANKGLLDKLEELVKETNEQVDVVKKESEAAKKLAEKVQENLKNYQTKIIESVKPPTTGLEDGKTLWLDISNGKPGILKLWKNGNWESVVPDVETIKKDTIEQVSKDIKLTKEELNKKVEQAQEETTGQFNTVTESLSKVTRTISDVQRDQGEIDKKVTLFEQDSNGFKTSIESLTKKDTEISNKLNTVESNVEGTKRAISDVQQTTSELKKTTTEIEEKAGKISEKLTNVETKVNSDKTGGRNLLLKSNVKYEKTDYLINQYSLTENFFAGEEYTFVIKGSVSQGQKFGIWQNGGSSNVGYATSVYANGITYVTFKAVVATSGNERKLSLYNYPSSTTKSIVEWVALYKGNKPQDWTAPPEEQVTTDEFTKKTTEITKSVDGIKETITKVENNQNGFENRVTTVEKTAEGITQSVKSLQNTQTDQGRQLQEAKAGWENTAKALEGKVEIKQVEDYVGGFQIPELKNTVTKNKQDLLDEISKKVATESYNTKVTELERLISANAQGISLAAVKTEIYTRTESDNRYADKAYVERQAARIDLTEKAITSTVQKGDIISAINQTAEQITIDVAKLNINADTVVKWLTAKGINADVIKISGDKVTIDKNGITAKMADFLYEDDNGQKFSVIPRKNLIVDHCFAHITKGYQNAQFFNIQYSPFWEIHGSPAVENSIVETGMEGMINAMRINGEDWIRYKHFRDVQPGKKYTISAHFRAAMLSGKKVTAEPTIRVKFGTWQGDNPVDKQIFEKKFSAPKIADGKIVRYTVTFTVPSDYNMSNGYIFFDIFAYGQVAYGQSCMVSGVQLVEGELPCIYNWDLSYAQAIGGETPFSGFTLGTVDNAFLFENNRNKIPFITAAGDGHALEVKGVSHTFVSFTDQNGRFGYIGHGSPGAGTFHIDTRNPVWVSNRLTARGINIGSGTFGSAGSMEYYNGAQGWGFYYCDGQWKMF
ncbi:TPA: phage tail spike protein [Bacillus cereus]